MSENSVIEVLGITKRFAKHNAVNNVSFNGLSSEILGIFGLKNAGKTTLLNIISGLIKKDKGTVLINNYDLDNDFEKAIANVGAIVQIHSLYENLTGRNNLKYFSKLKKANKDKIDKVIDFLKITDMLDKKVKNYSLSMKLKLSIGIALLNNPKLLILDEPTNGLDPVSIRDLRLIIQKIAHEQSICVIISGHLLWELEKLCDRVIILSNGMIIGETEVKSIINNNLTLEDYYISLIESSYA